MLTTNATTDNYDDDDNSSVAKQKAAATECAEIKSTAADNLIGVIFYSRPSRDFDGMWEQQVICRQGGPALRQAFFSFLSVFSLYRPRFFSFFF